MKRVALQKVLVQDRRAVPVEPRASYPSVGVLNRGRGLFHKSAVKGAETSYRMLYPLGISQVVYSKLFAWEGSVAVVDDEFAGSFVSSEFPHFDIDTVQVEPMYLRHVLAADFFTDALGRSTTGMGQRRQRVNVDSFLHLTIPLPGIDEQRAIAARLDSIATMAEALTPAGRDLECAIATLRAGELTGPADRVELSELITLRRREHAVHAEETYRTAGVRWYGEGLFHRATLPGREIRASTVFGVEPGDLVYNRLFAWKGSFALASEEHRGLVVSNEFPVFTIDEERVDAEYLRGWLALPSTWETAATLSTGGTPTSRNRLKIEQLLKMSLPVPSAEEQRRTAARLRRTNEMTRLDRERQKLATALPQAARNEVFSNLA